MALSAYSPLHDSAGGDAGEDYGDSAYGSLVTLGPRKFKKKPVLVLDAEELAKAHEAMALGGAQIMEAADDPEAMQRIRQPAVILGLVPMGVDEDDDDRSAYPAAALAAEEQEPVDAGIDYGEKGDDDDWVVPAGLLDEDEEPEGDESALWVDDEDEAEVEEDLAPAHNLDHLLRPSTPRGDWDEPSLDEELEAKVPSIEEQLKRMRALPIARPQAEAEPEPVVEPQAETGFGEQATDEAWFDDTPTSFEVSEEVAPQVPPAPSQHPRIEIDDWSDKPSLRGYIPPDDRDLEWDRRRREVAKVLSADEPELDFHDLPQPAPVPEPAPVGAIEPEPEPVDLVRVTYFDDEDEEPVAAVVDSSRIARAEQANTLRARLVTREEAPQAEDPVARPSLFARLWAWLFAPWRN